MTSVSVIVPVYNGEKYIENCIKCLNNQTLEDIEIIFVDDGSTDNSYDKLKKYEGERIIVIRQSNAGAGAARNRGIHQATGEYIAFLDVDDVYASDNTLELLYKKAVESETLICGGSLKNNEMEMIVDDKRVFKSEGIITFEQYQFDFGFQRFIFNRKMILENKIVFPMYRVYEDPVFLAQAMVVAKRFYAIPDIVYIYSGSHQSDLDVRKTIDYISGLRDNLLLSSKFGYGRLHKLLFERLKSSGAYYVEKNLDTLDVKLYEVLLSANASIDRVLLENEGVEIEEGCFIPTLYTIWRACGKYMRLQKIMLLRRCRRHFRRKAKRNDNSSLST